MSNIPFLQAKYYRKGRDGHSIDLIVIHSMEAAEKGNTAEAVAQYFHRGPTGPDGKPRPASAHYCCDSDSVVACVHDDDQAAAAPGANRQGLHFELAGYARQSLKDWEDEYSDALLRQAAALCAEKAKAYGVPVRWLMPDELARGMRGFTSHYNVSLAWKRSTHTDPGPGFPVGRFLRYVREAAG